LRLPFEVTREPARLHVVAFQVGWFACVLSAAHGKAWIGVCLVGILLGLPLFFTTDRLREFRLLLSVGVVGFVVDSVQAACGLFSFGNAGAVSWVSPPWMVALWLNLAATLRLSLRWLTDRALLAAVLGAVAGPLSYYAGVRLGAFIFPADPVLSLAILAAI
jgi:hypothetical protein